MALVGQKAPAFNAPAVINGEEIVEGFSLDQYVGKKYVVLFFYPKDFTFICPTEILTFQNKLAEFEQRDTVVVGVSCDTEETHLAWLNTARDNGGIEGVKYPLVADSSKTIAVNYDILAGDWETSEEGELTFSGAPIAYRATFLIDKEGVVRQETVNDLPLGRNIDETLRLVDALRHVETHGEVCPANWSEGESGMEATREGVASYLSENYAAS